MEKLSNKIMYGAIIGDIAGSCYEFSNNKDCNVPLFPKGCAVTDDSILTCATAQALMTNTPFAQSYRYMAKMHPAPKGCYGCSFVKWLAGGHANNSMGNGAPMRVSACGWWANTPDECAELAAQSAICSHAHWQAVRCAQAVAMCIFYAHKFCMDPETMREMIINDYELDIPMLDAEYKTIQASHHYTELAEPTTTAAIWCALSADSFEDAIRRAIGLGGDADTLAAIAGSIAEAIYFIPESLVEKAREYIPADMLGIISKFNKIISNG